MENLFNELSYCFLFVNDILSVVNIHEKQEIIKTLLSVLLPSSLSDLFISDSMEIRVQLWCLVYAFHSLSDQLCLDTMLFQSSTHRQNNLSKKTSQGAPCANGSKIVQQEKENTLNERGGESPELRSRRESQRYEMEEEEGGVNERRGRESKQRVQEHVKDSRVKERYDDDRRGRRGPEVRVPRGKGKKKNNELYLE